MTIRMIRLECLIAALATVLIGLPGCSKSEKPHQQEQGREEDRWKEIEACLPEGIVLSHGLAQGTSAPTVKDKLVELQAYAKDGKLYDGSGKEIRFLHRVSLGSYFSKETRERHIREQNEEFERLRKEYSVIELTYVTS